MATVSGNMIAATLAATLAGLKNGRAWQVLAAGFLLVALAIVLLGALSSWLASSSGFAGGAAFLVSALLWASLMLVVVSSAGILLSDDVWQHERRDIRAAIGTALSAVPRMIASILLAGAAVLAATLLVALLLLPCRIPGLGVLLYALLLPVASVAMGALVCLLGYVLLPLAFPCLWLGNTIAATLATLTAVMRHRLADLLIRVLVLAILVVAVGAVTGAVVFSGAGIVSSLSLMTIGVGDGAPTLDMPAMASGGYGIAFGFGMLSVTLLASLPAMLVALNGIVLIHRDVTTGLDVGDAAEEWRQALAKWGERLRALPLPAFGRKTATTDEAAAAPRICPNAACGKEAGTGELFCTACGERLK